jgi:anti-sigma regulatory factor (Ser/Thr protein kinase)
MRVLDPISKTYRRTPGEPELRLTLQGRLEELAGVWPWVEALAGAYRIPPKVQYAVNLCLEEALSNIVRHGYGGGASLPIIVDFLPVGADAFFFTIEDRAPHFDPLHFSSGKEAHSPTSLEDLEPGGLGIPLLRKFAGSLSYEPLSNGNRLTIGFSNPPVE